MSSKYKLLTATLLIASLPICVYSWPFISPYASCSNNPVYFIDPDGDSIRVSPNMIDAIYNGIGTDESISLKFNNGILDPNSIYAQAKNTDNLFLKDLYYISTNPMMVDVKTSNIINYMGKDGKIKTEPFGSTPYDYTDDFDPALADPPDEYGFHIQGNTGQSLFPIMGLESGKRSTSNEIQIIINAAGNLNHRTVGVAHEFAHVVLFLMGKPFGHRQPGVDEFIYGRTKHMSRKLGYDY